MAKTATTRFGQSQYSSGSDTFRRVDYNTDGSNIETRAAYDDGVTYATLPAVADTRAGRYVMHQPTGNTYKTLYRATGEGGTWEQAVGTAVPAPLAFRPHVATSYAATATAASFAHPNLTNPGATVTYDGAAAFGRAVVLDLNDGTKTALHVGTSAAPAPGTLGRAHVRTTTDGDKGLVLQPHGAGAGNTFTAREPTGQDVVTIDPNGYLRARSLSGFGGGALDAATAVVVAPTSSATDAVTTGLLLYGQSSAPSKRMLQVLRDAADTAPIVNVYRDSISLGRLPWGDVSSGGTISSAGKQITHRALGYDSDTVLWKMSLASATTPTDTTLDQTVLSLSRASSLLRAPLTATQELATGGVNLTLKRFTEFNGRFIELRRAGTTDEVVSAWEPDGRLSIGARWVSAGTMYDARNSLWHSCKKRWATPGVDGYRVGIKIDSGNVPTNNYTYTFALMQMRSSQATDVNARVAIEYCIENETDDFGSSMIFEHLVSVNGGAFTSLATTEHWTTAVRVGDRPVGNSPISNTVLKNAPAGATVQWRVKLTNNGSDFGPPMYLRMLDLNIEETIISTYTAP